MNDAERSRSARQSAVNITGVMDDLLGELLRPEATETWKQKIRKSSGFVILEPRNGSWGERDDLYRKRRRRREEEIMYKTHSIHVNLIASR